MTCGTTTCSADANYRVAWPGQPIQLCSPCTARAVRIADAMGFALIVDPIDQSGALCEPWPLCSWPAGCLAAAAVEGGRCPIHQGLQA